MNIQPEPAVPAKAAVIPLSLFERYLTLWVALMLLVAGVVNHTRGWYEDGAGASSLKHHSTREPS